MFVLTFFIEIYLNVVGRIYQRNRNMFCVSQGRILESTELYY